MSTQPIPIFLCGKLQPLRQAAIDLVKPEFDVIATADSKETILAQFPTLLAEDKIRGVIMGGGFSNEFYAQIRDEINDSKNVPWIRPEASQPGYEGPQPSGPPTAEEVSKKVRKALVDHIDELRQGKGAGEVWYY